MRPVWPSPCTWLGQLACAVECSDPSRCLVGFFFCVPVFLVCPWGPRLLRLGVKWCFAVAANKCDGDIVVRVVVVARRTRAKRKPGILRSCGYVLLLGVVGLFVAQDR